MNQLTVLVVSFMLFCNFEFVCLDHSFFFSLCVFNGGCIMTDCPLGPARRFLHDDAGRDLLAGVSALLRPLGHTNPSNEFLMQILLYGDKDFPVNLNKDILLLTLRFIHETGRFD